MKAFFLFVPLLLYGSLHAGHPVGVPPVISYSPQQYRAGGQNWDIDRDKNGMLYFANNEGLLTFNGHYWQLHPVPNNTRLRAVKVAPDGCIYTGAQDEIGYFRPDQQGRLQYVSLKKLIPLYRRTFADVWNIAFHEGAVFFRTTTCIFRYDGKQITVSDAPAEWRLLAVAGGRLFAQDQSEGLLEWKKGRWQKTGNGFPVAAPLITTILPGSGDTLILTTLKHGLFKMYGQQIVPFKTPADAALRSNRIYCAVPLADAQLALGTSSGGCYIIHRENGGSIRRFTMQEGLQNNNILRLFSAGRDAMWLALDNGIDLLRYNSPVKQIHPDKGNALTTYAASVLRHHLYIGTSSGLYCTPLDSQSDFSTSPEHFLPVAHTNGQVWSLTTIGQQLLLGHHEGAFIINGHTATPLLRDAGCWRFLPLSQTPPLRVFAGFYNGLRILHNNGNDYTGLQPVHGLSESLRFLAADNNPRQMWASHPYRGVYRFNLTSDTTLQYTLYTRQHGLPSDYNNYVFRIKQQLIVSTSDGLYEFDARRNRFVRSPRYYPIPGPMAIQYLTEDSSGHIWFVAGKKTGMIDYSRQPAAIIYFPELEGRLVSGFECIYPYNEENIFFGAEKGMYHLNYRRYRQTAARAPVLLGRITADHDSLLYGGYVPSSPLIPSLPHHTGSFHFEYAVPMHDAGNRIAYSYRLSGMDDNWSEWSPKTEKEYTRLPHGRYTFAVKAKDNLGNESPVTTYTFSIRPAWYQSNAAKAAYVLLLLALGGCTYYGLRRKFRQQQQRYRREQEQLIFLHQLERERSEKLLVQLQKDQLESAMRFKNNELATITMHLVQRGRLLADIREELSTSIKKMDTPPPARHFSRVLRLLEEAEHNQADWDHFSRHFDEVYNNFLLILKKKYPELTTTDLKLCAYLRINLTTKEIAQSMGISVRGVETGRYRLRKKLGLTGDTPLYNFLLGITEP